MYLFFFFFCQLSSSTPTPILILFLRVIRQSVRESMEIEPQSEHTSALCTRMDLREAILNINFDGRQDLNP